MSTTRFAALSDPFAMLIEPEQVVRAMEHSQRLARLQRRVYRPLDKPLIPRVGAATQAFDSDVDLDVDLSDE